MDNKMELCDEIEIVNENVELQNIQKILKGTEEKAKDYQQYILNSLGQNKNEFGHLKNMESDKQAIVKNNQVIISEMKSNLKIAQEKYEALVKEKDIQFKYTSKELSELADIKTTIATTIMKHFGFKLKLKHIENDTWEVKYVFNNNKEIILYYNIDEDKFCLQSITPTPKRLELMKEFLNSTQDITGFLYSANKYFQNHN